MTYVLLPGAGSDSWYWHLVVPELQRRGHSVVAPDLPCDDDRAGLAEYADVAVAAVGDRTELIVVAQSMGAFTAPLLCDRLDVRLLVLVAPMVPAPGESGGDWWANTGQGKAMRAAAAAEGRPIGEEMDPVELFLHDLPPAVRRVATKYDRSQSGTPFERPWPLTAWPDVPTRVLACRQDRLFPLEFQRRVVQERLGIVPDEMDGGHLPALSRPLELVERLESYRLELVPS